MKIKKSRPASQSTKVKRRKNKQNKSSPSTLAGYEVASLPQSLINTSHSPFTQFQRLSFFGVILIQQTGKKR